MLTPVGLSPLETACCLAFGSTPGARVRGGARRTPPATALIDALSRAMRRTPCVVAFSGGRDSSLLLAAARAAQRRDGLEPAIPVTLRFPAAPDAEESAWQERVIAHVGAPDWVRIDLPEGLDMIGPVAGAQLARHGLLFPPNAHLLAPMLEHAAGGTVVGGLGGDELFGLWQRRRLADLAAGRARPRAGDARHVAGALAPLRARSVVARRRRPTSGLPWLRPAADRELAAVLAEQDASMPLRWDRHAIAVPRAKSLRFGVRDLGRVAATAGAAFAAPLLDPRFAASLAAAGGPRGFGGRDATLRALFSDLLPADVLCRRDKATFNDAFFTARARRFAEAWSGGGLDGSVVDADAARAAWRAEHVDYRSALLLQSAWLHDHRAGRC